MIYALMFLAKCFYWITIGWWLEPIKFFKKCRIEKMQNEITKAEYQKIQEQKQAENKKSAE